MTQIFFLRNRAWAYLCRILLLFVENEAETEVHVHSLITYVQVIAFSGSTVVNILQAGTLTLFGSERCTKRLLGPKGCKNVT